MYSDCFWCGIEKSVEDVDQHDLDLRATNVVCPRKFHILLTTSMWTMYNYPKYMVTPVCDCGVSWHEKGEAGNEEKHPLTLHTDRSPYSIISAVFCSKMFR
jgi:hypothetical protein